MLDKFILIQCRNCKIMWLIMRDKDTVSIYDGYSLSTGFLLRYNQLLKRTKNV